MTSSIVLNKKYKSLIQLIQLTVYINSSQLTFEPKGSDLQSYKREWMYYLQHLDFIVDLRRFQDTANL